MNILWRTLVHYYMIILSGHERWLFFLIVVVNSAVHLRLSPESWLVLSMRIMKQSKNTRGNTVSPSIYVRRSVTVIDTRSLGPIGARETNIGPKGRIPKGQEHYNVQPHQHMQMRECN